MRKVLPLPVFLIILVLFSNPSFGTPDSIGVSKIDGKDYILHKVEVAEGWFSIARHYGITYSELRLANKDTTDMLQPGMTILIPLNRPKPGDPFYDKNYVLTGEEKIHQVKEGETLFSIAKKYSTSVDSIKKWNNLSDADLKAGQRLKVGYKTKSEASAKTEKTTPESRNEVSVKNNAPLQENISVKLPAINTDSNKAEPTKNTTEAKVDSTKIIKTASGMKPETKKPSTAVSGKDRKEITEKGIASWIRDDDINPNKYYALHRTAPIGTIIRVTNKMNNKYVFVKVVGALPNTGDNNDLLIKISKASAEKLVVHDSRFQCELSYSIMEKK